MENLVITSRSPEETIKFGAELAGRLKDGVNLLLCGELGAGKTTMLQGLGKGLGIEQNIISPTFQLVRKYSLPGGREFIHIDLYRLNSVEEILRIGWRDFIEGDQIVAVEWADRAKDIWTGNSYILNLIVRDRNSREIKLTEPG